MRPKCAAPDRTASEHSQTEFFRIGSKYKQQVMHRRTVGSGIDDDVKILRNQLSTSRSTGKERDFKWDTSAGALLSRSAWNAETSICSAGRCP